MTRYWESHPPLHLMVAAYLGIKPKAAPKDAAAGAEEFLSFLSTMPGAVEVPGPT